MPTKGKSDPLLWRFSLYGFLKNQQYYEPFFLLVLQAKGLSFFQIGVLFSFREICVNLMGIPAGFLADFRGRRSSLLVCFSAYIISFTGFAFARSLPWLFGSMFAFAVGESFRSGTHKAMIFHHLRLEGRETEKARVYGFTRSWSKLGSAASALFSGVLVLFTGGYERTFLYAIPPYLLNMLNVGAYPAALEGDLKKETKSVKEILWTILRETRACLADPRLRPLFLQSAFLQATAKTVIGYLQPLVVASVVVLAVGGPFSGLDEVRRSSVFLGILYFALNLSSAVASRQSYRLERLERSRFPFLWMGVLLAGLSIVGGTGFQGAIPGASILAVTGFVLVVVLGNVWRPLIIDRLDDASDSRFGAAVLSVEAQCSSLGVMLLAPVVGKVADRFGLVGVGWCVVGVGMVAGLWGIHANMRRPEAS
ncbi:MAG: MFS transporter [Fibrobacteres bacterium]|nr:MFS transporter [Fibrobacterota bacterium]